MPTRSFVLEGTERRFWDITWEGPAVEITSGKWGTNGRAREASFESVAARDAFIAAEIKKILEKGYRESGVVAPAADAPTAAIERTVAALARRIAAPVRPAWLPVFEQRDGDEAFGRVRGGMTLDADEEWPRCPVCREPLTGLFELDRSALPAPELRHDSVAQLFWCEAWEGRPAQAGDGGGNVCTADGGWVARLHRRGPHRRAYSTGGRGPGGRGQGTFAIVDWTRIEELPSRPEPSLRQALDDAEPEILEALVRSIAANGGALDGDEDAYATCVRALGKEARTEHKLGGWPVFVQEYDQPFASSLFQLEAKPPFDVNFGDLGAGHLLLRRDGTLDFFWSCH
jgi:predicted DNA-binding WGR domain protein